MNNLDDDFTPEEKALLKREMRYRINQQRMREQGPIRATITIGVLATGMKLLALRLPPGQSAGMDMVGNIMLVLTGILVIVSIIHYSRASNP